MICVLLFGGGGVLSGLISPDCALSTNRSAAFLPDAVSDESLGESLISMPTHSPDSPAKAFPPVSLSVKENTLETSLGPALRLTLHIGTGVPPPPSISLHRGSERGGREWGSWLEGRQSWRGGVGWGSEHGVWLPCWRGRSIGSTRSPRWLAPSVLTLPALLRDTNQTTPRRATL